MSIRIKGGWEMDKDRLTLMHSLGYVRNHDCTSDQSRRIVEEAVAMLRADYTEIEMLRGKLGEYVKKQPGRADK